MRAALFYCIRIWKFIGCCLLSPVMLPAQSASHYDSTYVVSYDSLLTVRSYLSQKYTLFVLEAPPGLPELQYRPNTKINLGMGATYKSITLNLAYGFGFLNRDRDKGKTRYLDLQSHIYGKSLQVDLFGQFYKGYFMYPRGLAAGDPHAFYQRPDLNVREIGVNAYYILNNKKFSYRAAFVQNEWQKKSAGTFLLGAGIVYGKTKADSAFVPHELMSFYSQRNIHALRYFELGPGIAYAYTFVWQEHLFVTAAATLSFDVGFVRETLENATQNKTSFSPNFLFRAVTGYNSADWNINFSWVMNRTAVNGSFVNGDYHITTGNYRFTVAKRFTPQGGLKRVLHKLDQLF